MTLRRATIVGAALMALSLPLSGCHMAGHLPPGQVKHVIAPPPGHGGVPPGKVKVKRY